MKNLITLILFLTLYGCGGASTEITTDTAVAAVDVTVNNIPNSQQFESQPVVIDFFKNKTLLSGTANRLIFLDENIIKVEFERYYDGSNRIYSISGIYKIDNGSIEVKWDDSNTVSWLNTWGECGLQTVRQSETFSNHFDLNNQTKCITVNTTFRQSFYAGQRCGNEDKNENNSYEFYLNQ